MASIDGTAGSNEAERAEPWHQTARKPGCNFIECLSQRSKTLTVLGYPSSESLPGAGNEDTMDGMNSRPAAHQKDLEVATRPDNDITPWSLIDIVSGICTATEGSERIFQDFRQWWHSPAIESSICSLRAVADECGEGIQIKKGAESWFSAWHDRLAPPSSAKHPELRHILDLALAIAFLREADLQSATINGDDLTILWDFMHNAIISPLFTRASSPTAYSAQGYFTISLCTLTGQSGNGESNELYSLNVWLPDYQRNQSPHIQSYQGSVQSWILAGKGEYSTFEVEDTIAPEDATHAEIESGLHIAENTKEQCDEGDDQPIHPHKRRLLHAIRTHSLDHTINMSFQIQPGTWHTLEVASDSLHAEISLLKTQSEIDTATRILGPKDVDPRVQVSTLTDMTPAILASNVNAVRLWEMLYNEGKWQERRSEMEDALRIFNKALSLCESTVDFPNASHYARIIHGDLGFTNRCLGRYTLASEHLEEALRDPGLNHHRLVATGELGTVYRTMNQLPEARTQFQKSYEIAKALKDDRATCRAVGNVGMTNYQLSRQHHDKVLLELAITQLKERVHRARQIKKSLRTEKMDEKKKVARLKHASVWESIGLNRLSLCYLAQENVEEAMKVVEESQTIRIEPEDLTVTAMSHFFYGRVLLRDGQRVAAIEHFNPSISCTPAIAMCKEPSEENRQYLQELVDVGVDIDRVDEYGYTALDYTVFGMDKEMEEIVIEGLRHTLQGEVDAEIVKRQYEARLRKGYRELFHDKMRPVLLKGGDDTLKSLRMVYASALETEELESLTQRFDSLKYVHYSDFLRCGRLPRHSDGFAKEFSLEPLAAHGLSAESMIFFSYRWINKQGNQVLPDNSENTQYHRMVEGTKAFLNLNPAVDPNKLGIWLVCWQLHMSIPVPQDQTDFITGLCLYRPR